VQEAPAMILVICGSNFISGAEFVLRDYLSSSALIDRMIVLTADTTENRNFFERIGAEVAYSPLLGQVGAIKTGRPGALLKKARNYLKSRGPVKSIIDERDIEKTLGNNSGDIIYARHVKKTNPDINFILMVHDMLEPGSIMARVFRHFDRFVDTYIAVSEAVRERLVLAGINKEKIEVIYNGIDPGITPHTKGKSPVGKTGEWTFGFVGNIEENKDPLAFVHFLQEYRHAGGSPRARMAYKHSDEPLLFSLRNSIDKAGVHVELAGSISREKIGDFYRGIDFLFVPFIDNSLPTVVLEAFSHGVPVIGRKSGGIPEMVDHGKNGFLFDCEKDFPTLCECILKMKNEHYKSMSVRASSTIVEKFSIQKKCKKLDLLVRP